MADAPGLRPPVWTGHLFLLSRDPAVAARFYEQLGMHAVQVEADFAVLEMRGGTHLLIRHDADQVAAGPAGWDLMVEDLDARHDQWRADGLSVTDIAAGPPHRTFEVTDPDGHVVVVCDSHVVGLV